MFGVHLLLFVGARKTTQSHLASVTQWVRKREEQGKWMRVLLEHFYRTTHPLRTAFLLHGCKNRSVWMTQYSHISQSKTKKLQVMLSVCFLNFFSTCMEMTQLFIAVCCPVNIRDKTISSKCKPEVGKHRNWPALSKILYWSHQSFKRMSSCWQMLQ